MAYVDWRTATRTKTTYPNINDYEESMKGLHPDIQQKLRNRLIETKQEETLAHQHYRGILKETAHITKEWEEGWFWR